MFSLATPLGSNVKFDKKFEVHVSLCLKDFGGGWDMVRFIYQALCYIYILV